MSLAPELSESISRKSKDFDFDPELIRALVLKESAGETFSFRHEPNYKYLWFYREFADRVGRSVTSEKFGQMCSWGPMQVMGAVAREYGFAGWFPELSIAELGVHYGCMHLKKLRDRFGPNEMDLISAYNQGSPRKTPGGLYENQTYVDAVWKLLQEARRL